MIDNKTINELQNIYDNMILGNLERSQKQLYELIRTTNTPKMVKIVIVKTFEVLDEVPEHIAMSMNIGDIFLPKGTGWSYKIVGKVCLWDDNKEYTFNVNVKEL